MSTRAVYTFIDQYDKYHVYKHHDGYPSGAVQWIEKALPHAWPLPRFEADEFAAAFIRGNKDSQGDVCLTHGPDQHGDLSFRYEITTRDGQLFIKVYKIDKNIPIFQGTLDEMKRAYPKLR